MGTVRRKYVLRLGLKGLTIPQKLIVVPMALSLCGGLSQPGNNEARLPRLNVKKEKRKKKKKKKRVKSVKKGFYFESSKL